MKRSRSFGVALAALVVAVVLISGTGSFSTMTGERPAQVAVVDDADAYLGVEQEIVETPGKTTIDESPGEDDSVDDPMMEGNSTVAQGNSTTPTNNATAASGQTGSTSELTITNRFTHGVTVEASVGEQSKSTDDYLDTGESHTFTFDAVECGEPIIIEATGSGVEATLDRTVECD